ncbi:hypothetical protein ATC00_25845 [Sinorhizobium americanum]|nr:hypothetical protein ATC00_25845 [Sinorhizobium americanum]
MPFYPQRALPRARDHFDGRDREVRAGDFSSCVEFIEGAGATRSVRGQPFGLALWLGQCISPGGKDEQQYEATRNFYCRNGFIPAEIFPTLWHEEHPLSW